MIKSIFKIILFISVVLAVGQIQLGKDTLGLQFVTVVKQGCQWGGQRLLQTKWLSGVELPGLIKDWITPKPPNKKKQETPTRSSLDGEMSKSDREAMLNLLK